MERPQDWSCQLCAAGHRCSGRQLGSGNTGWLLLCRRKGAERHVWPVPASQCRHCRWAGSAADTHSRAALTESVVLHPRLEVSAQGWHGAACASHAAPPRADALTCHLEVMSHACTARCMGCCIKPNPTIDPVISPLTQGLTQGSPLEPEECPLPAAVSPGFKSGPQEYVPNHQGTGLPSGECIAAPTSVSSAVSHLRQ